MTLTKFTLLFHFNDIFQVLFWEDGWWWGGGGGRGGVLSTLRGTTSKDVRILLHIHLHSTMEETARSWAHWCILCRCNLRLTGNMSLTKYLFCGFLSSSLPLLNDEKKRYQRTKKMLVGVRHFFVSVLKMGVYCGSLECLKSHCKFLCSGHQSFH